MTTLAGARSAAVERVLRQVAAWGLPGAPALDAGGRLDADDGAAVVERAVEERVIGLLAVAIEAGELPVDPATREAAVAAHRTALVWCLRLEVQLLHLLDLLAAVDVRPLVLKGPAIAHLDLPDPSLRTFADVDLLIAGAELDRAVAAIEADGAARSWAERRPGFDRRFAKSVTLRYPAGIEVDVHRSLCDGVHGFRIPIDELFARAETFHLAGREVRTLSRPHRALHAAYHLTLGSRAPRLMSVHDLAEHLCDPSLAVEPLAGEASRWRGDEVLAAAVSTCVDLLDIDLGPWRDWLDGRVPDRAEVAIVERQRREGSGIGWGKVQALRELPGLRRRVAYAWALVWPTRAHLRSRGRRRRDLVRSR